MLHPDAPALGALGDGAAEEAGEAQRPHQQERHAGAARHDRHRAPPGRVARDEGDHHRHGGGRDQRERERIEALRGREIEARGRERGPRQAAGGAGDAYDELEDAGWIGDQREE